MAITIRRLGPEDVAAFREIRLESLEAHPTAYSSAMEDEAAMPLSFFTERVSAPLPNTAFGGFAGDVLAGIVRVWVDPGVKMRHRGMIAGVYVRPAFRGTGLALRLMEASIAQARLDGLEALRLEVSAGNDNARALYASIGFQTYGIDRRAVRVGDVYVDEEMMTLSLI